MFYSQTFLARKGPLSTVWIAAHLHHRLKKSHYTTTDIPSTVMRIMDPGVPIALRMSGHLLLGVVRIYSKKVDYLFQDCKDALVGLHKAFDNLQTTHQDEARPAPFESVTLPETFDLDAQNIDDYLDHNGAEDLHLKNLEDITLTVMQPHLVATLWSQTLKILLVTTGNSGCGTFFKSLNWCLREHDLIPVSTDYRVTVSFDEDVMMDSSRTEVLPDSGAIPTENIIAQSPQTNVMGAEDHGPSNLEEPPTIQHSDGLGPGVHSVPQSTPAASVEHIRGPNNDFSPENSPVFSNLRDNDSEPNRIHDPTVNEKDHVSETFRDLVPEEVPVPSQQHFNPPTPPTSQGGTSNAQAHVENNFQPFELDKSPPIQQPQRRARKRKQFFDESIVLTNRFMRNALNDSRDILRKRKDLPSSSLGTWKLNNSRRKELIFDQPLLTGVCKDLLDISKSEYVRSRPQLVISEEDHADAMMAETLSPTNQAPEQSIAATDLSPEEPTAAIDQSPEEPIAATNQPLEELIVPTNQTSEVIIPDTSPVAAFDMEIEHLRNVAVTPLFTVPEHNVVEGDYVSPDRRDDLTTMASPLNTSVASMGTNIASERMQTLNSAASPGAYGSETMQTPDSDAYHMTNSAKTDEFWFLRLDSNTPASSHGTSGSNRTLSERTRSMPRLGEGATRARCGPGYFLDWAAAGLRVFFQVSDPRSPSLDLFFSRSLPLVTFIFSLFRPLDSLPLSVSPSGEPLSGDDFSSGDNSGDPSHTAQYLEKLSTITPILEEPARDLSLNKILNGKTKHIAARMFFEVLVLKTNNLIDVRQEKPYEDITLSFAPSLSNAQS
ncbi:hypothetical protein Fmac_018452 [Flemingia macrophylla]|uniref:Sister chromatid cohesion 1 protein 3 n=1 Tax=Flemingia macrophylla TaxID=520843 RepID=A0ABD1M547_9FABA